MRLCPFKYVMKWCSNAPLPIKELIGPTLRMRASALPITIEITMKRGSSLCKTCGHSNGNRALQCKECHTPLSKRIQLSNTKDSVKFNANVTSILKDRVLPQHSEVYSVKIREQGPDYRYFIYSSPQNGVVSMFILKTVGVLDMLLQRLCTCCKRKEKVQFEWICSMYTY